jgi:hypothetical protein
LLSAPAEFGWVAPVNVYFSPSEGYYTDYNPAPFLVEGSPGVTTIYVDGDTGNDANPGTAVSPKRSLATVTAGRASKLLIKARGTFYVGYTTNIQTAHDELCVEAWGGAACVLTAVGNPSALFLTWTDEGGGVWSAPAPWTFFNNINPYLGTDVETLVRYPQAASLAACQATPGTWFRQTSPSLRHFINTGGASPATGHTIFGCNGSVQTINNSARAYVQRIQFVGLTFRGGDAPCTVAGSNTHSKQIEFVSCAFQHANNFAAMHTTGNSVVITYGCTAGPSAFDGFSYSTASGSAGGVVPNAVEINNTGRNNGALSGANQGSTQHFGGKVIRVNCTYRNNADQQMADVGGGTRSWNLGCTFGPRGVSAAEALVTAGNDGTDVRIWLDGCTFSGGDPNVMLAGGASLFYKNMTVPSQKVGSAGTLAGY